MNSRFWLRPYIPILLSILFLFPGVTAAKQSEFTILMVVWRGCEQACQGFKDYIRERGIAAEIIIRDAQRDRSLLPEFILEAKKRKVDLVVTWGTSVTRGMVGAFDKVDPASHITEIPVIFMIVADPVGANIIESYDSSGRNNVTGTRNRVPEEVQIKAISAYRPLRKLGLLFNKDELNSVLNAEKIKTLAGQLGFELFSYELSLKANGKPNVEEIPAAISSMKQANVDFIYIGSSSFLMANRDQVTSEAIRQGLPVATAYEAMASESHALVAVASRYYNVGKLAAFQAEQVLINKVPPIQIPIRSLSRYSYIINMETARLLKIYPPLDVLRYAEIVKGS